MSLPHVAVLAPEVWTDAEGPALPRRARSPTPPVVDEASGDVVECGRCVWVVEVGVCCVFEEVEEEAFGFPFVHVDGVEVVGWDVETAVVAEVEAVGAGG